MIFLAVDDIDDSGEDTSPAPASKATQKVELDLDDAPFLEDEDEEEDLPEDEPEELESLEEAPAQKKSKSKLIIFIGIGVIILLLAAILAKLFLFNDAPPPAKEPAPIEESFEEIPESVPEEVPPPPEEPGVSLLRMDPFWIEQKDEKKNTRFLIARFAMTTKDERVVAEYGRKTLILRDAVYFYLKNKDLEFLADKKNVEKLKKDLLMVINQYIVAGEFEEILFEKYLVR